MGVWVGVGGMKHCYHKFGICMCDGLIEKGISSGFLVQQTENVSINQYLGIPYELYIVSP